jgi:hypothetical protein
LFHDVGKLQAGWQLWAERAQRSLHADYVHGEPLAHTDFDPNSPEDRERERALLRESPRPPHAAASAFYGAQAVAVVLGATGEVPAELFSACLAAVLAHHGGRLSPGPPEDLGLQPLVSVASLALRRAASDVTDSLEAAAPESSRAARATLAELLSPVLDGTSWARWWPVAAWLTRVLRLADQRATIEYGKEE